MFRHSSETVRSEDVHKQLTNSNNPQKAPRKMLVLHPPQVFNRSKRQSSKTSHIHAISILSFIPIYPVFETETRYLNKNLKEMATIYARLKNQ